MNGKILFGNVILSVIFIRFMKDNNESCGWVVKAPFTTNGESVRFAKSLDRILYFLRAASKKYFGEIPYIMIQACMFNRKEYKVIVLAGAPIYVASIQGSGNKRSTDGTNRSFSNQDGLLEFTKHSLERILSRIPYAITDGLFRVDIFQNIHGQLVVNEFESLDANYDGEAKFESLTKAYLQTYWRITIKEKFGECNLWII